MHASKEEFKVCYQCQGQKQVPDRISCLVLPTQALKRLPSIKPTFVNSLCEFKYKTPQFLHVGTNDYKEGLKKAKVLHVRKYELKF